MLLKNLARLLSVLLLLLCWTVAIADDDEEGWYGRPGIEPVSNSEFQQECGACHFPYQPGLLPAQSWQKLMADLEHHFGEDASLEPAVVADLTDYATKHAADKSDFRRSRTIARSLSHDEVPARITELRYFKHEHREIPRRMYQGNDRVRSLSNCNSCHTTAAKGIYSERGIEIPGFGYWED
jgi:hypothetical protein